jgi:Do/DeqQ family serine protease
MKKHFSLFAAAIIGGITVFALSGLTTTNPNNKPFSAETPLPVQLTAIGANNASAGIDFTRAADSTVHAVVHIKCSTPAKTVTTSPFGNDPFHNFFFGGGGFQMQTPPSASSGSGVIISEDGYICTNNHVIDKSEKIEVVLNNNKTYDATVIGKDPSTDLALLKIEEKNLSYVHFGNSDNVKVGEWVLAVGNPFNLTSTVTAGIISAKGRNINALDQNNQNRDFYPVESFLQTDAAVNPGNSGGALVNLDGELIGINSAIASATGYYTGYSFAIPVNIVRKVMSDLKDFGTVQRAFIGVSIRDIDNKLIGEKNLKHSQGAYVAGLTNNGAAETAGMREGDIILKIAGTPIKSTPELQEQISRYRPGDIVNVTIARDGVEKDLPVTLRNKNGETGIIKNVTASSVNKTNSFLGASFESISQKEMSKLKISGGIKVIKLQSGKLASSGIKEGFIITSIDKQAVETVEDLMNYIENKRGGVLIEGVYENGVRGYYGFGL